MLKEAGKLEEDNYTMRNWWKKHLWIRIFWLQ